MNLSLICACVWAILATAIAMGPRRFHWPGAWGLIVTGVPLLGWVTYNNGPIVGLICLAAGVSVLRWPVHALLSAMLRPRRAAK